MYTMLLVVHIIVSLFLIFIILIQSSKGEGLSDVFGGGSSQTTIFGSRTGNFLTKATTASAIIFMITCLGLAFLSHKESGSVVQNELMKQKITDDVQKMMAGSESKEAAGQEEAIPAVPVEQAASAQAETAPAQAPVQAESK